MTARRRSPRKDPTTSGIDWFLRGVASVVTLVWAIVVIRASVTGGTVDVALHGIMGLVAGALFGVSLPWRGGKDD